MSGDDLRVEEAKSRLAAALDTLEQVGQGPYPEDAISDYLWAKGIRGLRGDPMRCPVANYLRRYLPPEFREGLAVGCTYVLCPQLEFVLTLPDVVREFIECFDAGFFPALEEEGGTP